jgi:hypothetical protein
MEPTQSSETSAFNTRTPGKYPEDNLSLLQHGESLKSRMLYMFLCTVHSHFQRLWHHHMVKVSQYVTHSAIFCNCQHWTSTHLSRRMYCDVPIWTYIQSRTSHTAQIGSTLIACVDEFLPLKANVMAIFSHQLHVLQFTLIREAFGTFRLS